MGIRTLKRRPTEKYRPRRIVFFQRMAISGPPRGASLNGTVIMVGAGAAPRFCDCLRSAAVAASSRLASEPITHQ